jgi:hypothetical protein
MVTRATLWKNGAEGYVVIAWLRKKKDARIGKVSCAAGI